MCVYVGGFLIETHFVASLNLLGSKMWKNTVCSLFLKKALVTTATLVSIGQHFASRKNKSLLAI